MKYDLPLAKIRRAQVWLGELPPAAFLGEQIQNHSFPLIEIQAHCTLDMSSATAAVEAWFPAGPVALYALLGGHFLPSAKRNLDVEISISEREDQRYTETLAPNGDIVYVGLLDEFARGTLEAINNAVASGLFSVGGTLRLNCSAHSIYGSSYVPFSQIAVILAKLLRMASLDPSEAKLSDCFPENVLTRLPH